MTVQSYLVRHLQITFQYIFRYFFSTKSGGPISTQILTKFLQALDEVVGIGSEYLFDPEIAEAFSGHSLRRTGLCSFGWGTVSFRVRLGSPEP